MIDAIQTVSHNHSSSYWQATGATLQWRHDELYGVSNYQRLDSLLSRLFRRRSKKTSKLRVTDLCAGNSTVTSEFPAQMASNAEMFPFDDVIMTATAIHWHPQLTCHQLTERTDVLPQDFVKSLSREGLLFQSL